MEIISPREFFNPVVKKTGIETLRWHTPRHTFASRLVIRGNDLRTAQELMGHKRIDMTLRYSHLSPAHKIDAVQILVKGKNEIQTDTSTATGQKDGGRQQA